LNCLARPETLGDGLPSSCLGMDSVWSCVTCVQNKKL
jgi:hypothetical protein